MQGKDMTSVQTESPRHSQERETWIFASLPSLQNLWRNEKREAASSARVGKRLLWSHTAGLRCSPLLYHASAFFPADFRAIKRLLGFQKGEYLQQKSQTVVKPVSFNSLYCT